MKLSTTAFSTGLLGPDEGKLDVVLVDPQVEGPAGALGAVVSSTCAGAGRIDW